MFFCWIFLFRSYVTQICNVGLQYILYMIGLEQADVMSVFSGFLGFTSHCCDEAWTGWCFSMELVAFKVTVEISGLSYHLGLQRYWNRRYDISIWKMKSNVFFKYFKHSWAQKETPVSGFQQRHSIVIVYK